MAELRNKDTGELIGNVTADQVQFMIDHLEEESETDQDYWLNRATIDMFREEGADAQLLAMLEDAMGEGDDVEVEWS